MPPLYDYKCKKCAHCEERIEPITAPLIQQCPKCKVDDSFIREIGAPTVVFNGGGWAKDLYNK